MGKRMTEGHDEKLSRPPLWLRTTLHMWWKQNEIYKTNANLLHITVSWNHLQPVVCVQTWTQTHLVNESVHNLNTRSSLLSLHSPQGLQLKPVDCLDTDIYCKKNHHASHISYIHIYIKKSKSGFCFQGPFITSCLTSEHKGFKMHSNDGKVIFDNEQKVTDYWIFNFKWMNRNW